MVNLGQFHPSDQSCVPDSTTFPTQVTSHLKTCTRKSKQSRTKHQRTRRRPTCLIGAVPPPSSIRHLPTIRLRSFLSQQPDSLANMEEKVCEYSSNKDSDNDDDEVYLQNASDEEDFQFSPASLTKLQFRNTKSKGRWNEEMGMAELFEKNGKMWVTTGIVRNGKIYTSIEETLYLMELEAFDLLDNDDRSISLSEMYEKVAGGKFGCCWELFEAYRHLKSLGYIIARHDVAWSLKSIRSSLKSSALEGTEENKQLVDMVCKVEVSIDKLFGDLKINDLKPDFDVYLPNNRFRKSSPGDPNFLLYLSRGHPPSKAEIEVLERQCGGIPLKICLVAEGRVSFFSFDKVELSVLP